MALLIYKYTVKNVNSETVQGHVESENFCFMLLFVLQVPNREE